MEQFTSLKKHDSEILPLRPIEELLDVWIVCPNTVMLVEGAILVTNFKENESAQVRSDVIVDNKKLAKTMANWSGLCNPSRFRSIIKNLL